MRPLVIAAVALSMSATLAGQWVAPEPPCDIKPGHFRINSAVVNLKAAAEKPTQRDRMLAQTVDVLTRSIVGDNQDQNPAAWYYLGRYYVEMGDAAGADSAFDRAEALAPACTADIARYRGRVWTDAYNAAQGHQQAGRVDSAAMLYRRAYALVPADARPLYALGNMFATRDQIDSATAYLRRAAEATAADTAYAAARHDALSQVARLHFRRAQGSPQVQALARVRFSRDSLDRRIAVDSIILGRMEGQAASRRARGARLSPADQQGFARDSSGRAEALAAGRASRDAVDGRVAGDSAAAAPVLTAAIGAFREFLVAYPTEGEAVTALALLFAYSGRMGEATATFDVIYPRQSGLDGAVVVDAGQRAIRVGLTGPGAALLERGLAQAPYDREGWNDLATAYRRLADGPRMVESARRVVALDPLSRNAVRQLATAWELAGQADSVARYQALADTGIKVDVTVASFVAGQGGHTLTGIAANALPRPSAPMRLTFEFLDAAGQPLATTAVQIPAMAATATHQFEVRVAQPAARGWRYRLN